MQGWTGLAQGKAAGHGRVVPELLRWNGHFLAGILEFNSTLLDGSEALLCAILIKFSQFK